MSIEDERAHNDAGPHQQFGDTKTLDFTSTPGLTQAVGTNVIRWQGLDKSDARAWRMYLGPWQPKPEIVVSAPLDTTYDSPHPWAGDGAPDRFDRMFERMLIYGRITFGSGGATQMAFVDWPVRGCLVQVSGSYVQLDIVASSGALTANDNLQLPILAATLGPEPGGGDSAAPATFTYPALPLTKSNAIATWTFQIPPFARTFKLLPQNLDGTTAPAATQLLVSVQNKGAVSATTYNLALPLADPSTDYPIPQSAADVVITSVSAGLPLGAIAVLFHLDL